MPDIVISEFMNDQAVASLTRDFSVLYDPSLHRVQSMLGAIAADARALIVRNETRVGEPLLDACPRLVAIGALGVDLDNVDVEACRARNVAVLTADGAMDAAVAEYVMTGLLMLLRAAYGATAAVAKGVWPRQALIGREIMGKTLGVVGFGDMAREVARRAGAFGMRVVAHDPDLSGADPAWGALGVSPRTLPELLAEADAVSLHLPLTEATHDLIDSVAIATMKRGAVLLNAARGGLVDETALAQALREGRLGGAMLDAYKKEPLPGANPFHDIPNLILTPRIAGVTEESNMRVGATVAEAVRRVLESGRTR